MLIPDTWEEQLFEVLPIIFLVFAYPNNAVLDNVGHNHFIFLFDFLTLLYEKCGNVTCGLKKNVVFLKYFAVFCYFCTQKSKAYDTTDD